ncbi:hypothetical protein [Microcoleus sp. D2_18a_B4]|uniref:hypothetical protein n=1 Tax=Microcoleus sp. D2_18a_B4 TaxID=3055329 RepID=UPI002FD1A0BD
MPEITDFQKRQLDQIKAAYFNLWQYRPILEKTISLSIVYPLLFAGEFYSVFQVYEVHRALTPVSLQCSHHY